MSITFKTLTLRNFLSIGAVTQAVNFDRDDLTLILGENLDMGGQGNRNGVGKTAMLQGLVYALYGLPINNIRKDNLINKTNNKNMLVVVEFTRNNTTYKIERGRRPNILKFYTNNVLQSSDDAQGDSRETQIAIDKVLGLSHDMFRHLVILNTYSEPFLALKTGDQRDVIEQLLGITLLSEKAAAIKELMGVTKDNIKSEEYKVKAIEEANNRILTQINSLRLRQKAWLNKHNTVIDDLSTEYQTLSSIDIQRELSLHQQHTKYTSDLAVYDAYTMVYKRDSEWNKKHRVEIDQLQTSIDKMQKIDISKELADHTRVATYRQEVLDKEAYDRNVKTTKQQLKTNTDEVAKVSAELKLLYDKKCYVCNQPFHDDNHTAVITKKEQALLTAENAAKQLTEELTTLEANPVVVSKMPSTIYRTEAEAVEHNNKLASLLEQLAQKQQSSSPYSEQLAEYGSLSEPVKPEPTIYETEAEAIAHVTNLINVEKALREKCEEADPYAEQIAEMESNAIQEVNFDTINAMTNSLNHQKFVLELLVNKDSVVRKKIIDQNLSFLNARLTHYLDKLGLPHSVLFKNDLSVEINELGRELDFDSLSRGERNRLILGLSFAFRDVWENLYVPINLLVIDELLDSGMDTAGMENGISVLKHMSRSRNKSIWLVSHKDELVSRVDNILTVTKENGFTSLVSS